MDDVLGIRAALDAGVVLEGSWSTGGGPLWRLRVHRERDRGAFVQLRLLLWVLPRNGGPWFDVEPADLVSVEPIAGALARGCIVDGRRAGRALVALDRHAMNAALRVAGRDDLVAPVPPAPPQP